jgi:hypothetical protein
VPADAPERPAKDLRTLTPEYAGPVREAPLIGELGVALLTVLGHTRCAPEDIAALSVRLVVQPEAVVQGKRQESGLLRRAEHVDEKAHGDCVYSPGWVT